MTCPGPHSYYSSVAPGVPHSQTSVSSLMPSGWAESSFLGVERGHDVGAVIWEGPEHGPCDSFKECPALPSSGHRMPLGSLSNHCSAPPPSRGAAAFPLRGSSCVELTVVVRPGVLKAKGCSQKRISRPLCAVDCGRAVCVCSPSEVADSLLCV